MDTRVCATETEARAVLDQGGRAVLILPPGTPPPAHAADPARLAYLIGDPGDPAVRATAEAMAADVWPRPS